MSPLSSRNFSNKSLPLLKRLIFFPFLKNQKFRSQISNLTGFVPHNINLYHQAFRHNSVSAQIGTSTLRNSNERLEFLGDAVLDSVVAEFVFKKFPFQGEGYLTDLRSRIVSREQLNQIAGKMGLEQFLDFDKTIRSNPKALSGILGNAIEALIGAVYLDRDYSQARKFILRKIIRPHIDLEDLENKTGNFKGLLVVWAQKNKKALEFKLLGEHGKANYKRYIMAVFIDGAEVGRGEGFSKKNAGMRASEAACLNLGIEDKAT